MEKKQKGLKLIIFVLLVVFSVSIFKVVQIKSQGAREEKAFAQLRQGREAEEKTQRPKENPWVQKGYEKLYEKNQDLRAWVQIPQTKLDYPVMYTPGEVRYYLRRGFDKNYALSGTPFIGLNGDIDKDMFIIYGHNMSNGTMFAALPSYEKEDFYQDHKEIILTTPEEERAYEVFASLKVQVPVKDGVAYYNYSGDLDDASYKELVQYLEENSLIQTGTGPKNREQILILSTCSYHTEDGRFFIAAKRIR